MCCSTARLVQSFESLLISFPRKLPLDMRSETDSCVVHPQTSKRRRRSDGWPVCWSSMGAFRQRGPDDERMSGLEPLRFHRSISVGGDAASGISKGEGRASRECAEPDVMRMAGTHLDAASVMSGNVLEAACAFEGHAGCCPSAHLKMKRNMHTTRCALSRGKYPGGSLVWIGQMCLDSRRAW